jgi:Spy/CpxP family protein refolding chaperone
MRTTHTYRYFVISFLFMSLIAFTMNGQEGDGMRRIHAAKMAYITDRLSLTADQSAKFMPIYNEYEKEIRQVRRSFIDKYGRTNPVNSDDSTSQQYIDDRLDAQEKVIAIKRRYNDRFLSIITPQQLALLYKAETEFNDLLKKRLQQGGNNRRGGKRHGDWDR